MTTGTSRRRPGRPATGKTPLYRARVKREIQEAFRAAAGRDHPAVVAALMAWYARVDGVTLPARPADE